MTDKEKEIAKGFTAIEINGVTFHSVQEMLVYMNNLRKENAELNRDKTELTNSVTELKTKITELKKQIDQLTNDNYVLKTAFITQKEQIEKMKCCVNCKHEQDSNTNYYCEDCKRFANETDIDKWKLM